MPGAGDLYWGRGGGGEEYNMALFSRSKSTKGEAHVIMQMPFTVKGAIIRTRRNAQSAEFGRQV